MSSAVIRFLHEGRLHEEPTDSDGDVEWTAISRMAEVGAAGTYLVMFPDGHTVQGSFDGE